MNSHDVDRLAANLRANGWSETDARAAGIRAFKQRQYEGLFAHLRAERARQVAKHGEQLDMPSVPRSGRCGLGIDPERFAKRSCEKAFAEGRPTWAHVAVEELAEAIDAPTEAARREELIQLATVCLAWIEAIDHREGSAS